MSQRREQEDPRLRAMFDAFGKNGSASPTELLQAADSVTTEPEEDAVSLKDAFKTKYRPHIKWLVTSAREINEDNGSS